MIARASQAAGEEVWRSLESVEFFDVEAVVDYALLLGNATTAAKVGFYLEQHGRVAHGSSRSSSRNCAGADLAKPHYLDGARNGRGRLVSAWNLVVPREVVEPCLGGRSREDLR